ncbi:hypothetical protein [Novosphingobium sp. ES2-1]|uniref:hypothetical protein n=1 Tax=Novosphingobium sp. ES2-1 TaxID=2780074 RepID=UPI0018813481|nr:hypothetical protein [Novosphingobium sp. ES2-1]QOV92944.1 hypothetical protein IM701_09730 [Novosphingobium sp. ES2-1]
MTADEYAKQRGELERGISYAERDYNSAAFRLQTGAATGAALALGGLQSSMIVGNRGFFDQLSAEEREQRFAEQLRGSLRHLAPKEV